MYVKLAGVNQVNLHTVLYLHAMCVLATADVRTCCR